MSVVFGNGGNGGDGDDNGGHNEIACTNEDDKGLSKGDNTTSQEQPPEQPKSFIGMAYSMMKSLIKCRKRKREDDHPLRVKPRLARQRPAQLRKRKAQHEDEVEADKRLKLELRKRKVHREDEAEADKRLKLEVRKRKAHREYEVGADKRLKLEVRD